MTIPFRSVVIALLAVVAPTLGSAATQNITFDPIPNQIFGIAPFPITAKASSGLPVWFTSTTPTVCKTAGALVQPVSSGSCNITANQAGNSTYGAATPVTRGFTVSQARPSGTLTQAPGSPFAIISSEFIFPPQSIVAADFNGDGIADLATADSGGFVTIFLGNGSGGFFNPAGGLYTVGSDPICIVTGDFNGDGFNDLAVANYTSANVSVLLGNGSGGFQQAQGSPFAVGPDPYSIAVGDFNGDGIQDLVATTIGNTGSAVTVMLGNGHGGFSAMGNFSVGGGPKSVVVADFNGDGIEDVATANSFDGTVSVLLGDGAGGFTAAPGSGFAVTAQPRNANLVAMAVGDFNLDGVPDLVVADQITETANVFIGNGSGGFAAASGSPFAIAGPAPQPNAVVVADFDGDGFPDIAVANYGTSTVTVLLGNGLGGFNSASFPVGPAPYSIAAADFNGDGIEDLVTANLHGDNVTVLLGGIAQTTSVFSINSPLTIASGQAAPLTLTVSDQSGGFDTPTGTATFKDGAAILGMTQGASPYNFAATGMAVGNHVLTASYSGDQRNAGSSGNSISIQITVGRAPQSILFEPPGNQTYAVTPAPLSTSATSGLAVVLTSTTPATCTVSGVTLTLLAPGNCSITASQAGNANFAPAIPVTQSFTVNQGTQTIIFWPQVALILPVPSFGAAATSTSGLPVSYVSSTTSICTVNATLLFFIPISAGTCIITAGQAGNVDYAAAAPVTQAIPVVTNSNSVGTLIISQSAPALYGSYGGPPVTHTATMSYKTSVQGAPSFTSVISVGSQWLSISPSSGPLAQTSFTNSIYTYSATVTLTGNPVFAPPEGTNGTVVFGVNGAVNNAEVIFEINPESTPQATGGIANAASASQAPPSVVAPGSFIAIYGSGLAGNGNPAATNLPLPTTLNGTSISLGGLPMPLLYASASQVNALVPQGLEPNTSYPLVVTTGYMKSLPVTLTVTELQPGIYTLDTSGSGSAVVANALTGQLISASNPAHAGDYLVVYCTGMGPVLGQNGEAPPADGVAVPGTPLYSTIAAVTATIGGLSTPALFSGLTSTLAGLYQVNLQVPAGVTPGGAVSLAITAIDAQTGAVGQSNSVTIAVQ